MKKVVLSIDVEDWYHLDYFERNQCDASYSMMDGLDRYVELISELSLPSNFFVLGELAEKKIEYFRSLANSGFEIGSHGWDHVRPMKMTLEAFKADLERCIAIMREINEQKAVGYRAPCFSLDRERLDLVRLAGFSFDSSRIEFGNHPLYGSIEMTEYENVEAGIYKFQDFIEFEATTLPVLGRNIPISGVDTFAFSLGFYPRLSFSSIWIKRMYMFFTSTHLKCQSVHPLCCQNRYPL